MIKIRAFKIADTCSVAKIINETFKKYNHREGSKKAVEQYVDFYKPNKNNINKLKTNFSKTEIFFVATNNNEIVGIIRGRKNRVVGLFVNGKHHKKGIGKKLMLKFEKECVKKASKIIKIRASIYAAPFYQKLGYKKTTGIRRFKGLKHYSMKKILN